MKKLLFYVIALSTVVTTPLFGEKSGENTSSSPPVGTNLLYIVPRDQLGTNTWDNSGEYKQKEQTIYYVKDYSEIFGDDWIAVPVDENKSLFKLIGTYTPRKQTTLPSFQIDTRRYPLTEMKMQPTWPEGSAPKNILLKWVDWWQNGTEATPVVLILVRF